MTHSDVVVVGGGLSGLTAAWQLHRKSLRASRLVVYSKSAKATELPTFSLVEDGNSFPDLASDKAPLGYVGKVGLALDVAGNVGTAGGGIVDAYENGLGFGNVVQIVAGGAGLLGNLRFVNCFVAGTKVSTPNGLRDIETLEANDEVLSYDLNAGE